MKTTYLFYDLETTGLNKCFDQVMQFAAIRTDLELNELERHNIFIKLNPDVIPSPEALITHQISLEKLQECGNSELDAIEKIHALLNTPNTISVGYNLFGFDDEFLRFSFYRNLLPPYTHQYANGCRRMDMYPIAVLYFLFNNALIEWPVVDGKSSLKLEFLSEKNSLHNGVAHDALSDTEAVVELARRFYRDKKMWEYALGYFEKNTDQERIKKLNEGIMLDGKFGADKFYQAPVMSLGWHNHYKNQNLWLRLDDERLVDVTIDSIPEKTYVFRKKVGEAGLLLPLEQRFMRYLSSERNELVSHNKNCLAHNPELFNAISNYYREYKYPIVPDLDIDAALYQMEFLKSFEERLCQKFHASDLSGKIAMLREFSNDNLRQRAIRVLGRNYPGQLPENIAAEYEEYLLKTRADDISSAILDFRGGRRITLHMASAEIERLKKERNLNAVEKNILDDLDKYLKQLQ